jgi:tRNA-2-methylthio-N6-dimethylallyladenosine synthase
MCGPPAGRDPRLALTTDVIVGFPAKRTRIRGDAGCGSSVGFDDAYTFKFSPRDGTPATRLPVEMTVPDEVANERLARLIDTVRRGARERNMALLGARREVLVEKGARRGDLLQARTRDFKTVLLPGDDSMIGRYFTVELTGTTGSTFTGAVCHKRERAPLPMAG